MGVIGAIPRAAVPLVVMSGGPFHTLLLVEHDLELALGGAKRRGRAGSKDELAVAVLGWCHENQVGGRRGWKVREVVGVVLLAVVMCVIFVAEVE